jgi:hypothetical protein
MLSLVTLVSLRQPLAAAFGMGRFARVDASAQARSALLLVRGFRQRKDEGKRKKTDLTEGGSVPPAHRF